MFKCTKRYIYRLHNEQKSCIVLEKKEVLEHTSIDEETDERKKPSHMDSSKHHLSDNMSDEITLIVDHLLITLIRNAF